MLAAKVRPHAPVTVQIFMSMPERVSHAQSSAEIAKCISQLPLSLINADYDSLFDNRDVTVMDVHYEYGTTCPSSHADPPAPQTTAAYGSGVYIVKYIFY